MKHTKVELLKKVLIKKIADKFQILSKKPKVDSTLGFFVDGGRTNKDDFKEKWEDMEVSDVTTVRDANNSFHQNITKAQMKIIYKAIFKNGEKLFNWKWQKEIEINACKTVSELEAIVI